MISLGILNLILEDIPGQIVDEKRLMVYGRKYFTFQRHRSGHTLFTVLYGLSSDLLVSRDIARVGNISS